MKDVKIIEKGIKKIIYTLYEMVFLIGFFIYGGVIVLVTNKSAAISSSICAFLCLLGFFIMWRINDA